MNQQQPNTSEAPQTQATGAFFELLWLVYLHARDPSLPVARSFACGNKCESLTRIYTQATAQRTATQDETNTNSKNAHLHLPTVGHVSPLLLGHSSTPASVAVSQMVFLMPLTWLFVERLAGVATSWKALRTIVSRWEATVRIRALTTRLLRFFRGIFLAVVHL